jgi:hypothetical protein
MNIKSGWSKCLSNGELINGEDRLVDSGQASWSRTSQDIHSVSLFHDSLFALLSGQGDFWQSDDFILQVGKDGKGHRVTRRIQRRINNTDSCFLVIKKDTSLCIYLFPQQVDEGIQVTSDMINKWLTIEIDTIDNSTKWYLSDNRR